jgi:hypothetical protein
MPSAESIGNHEKNTYFSVLFLAILLSACSITPKYRSVGYHIEWKQKFKQNKRSSSTKKVIVENNRRLQPIAIYPHSIGNPKMGEQVKNADSIKLLKYLDGSFYLVFLIPYVGTPNYHLLWHSTFKKLNRLEPNNPYIEMRKRNTRWNMAPGYLMLLFAAVIKLLSFFL